MRFVITGGGTGGHVYPALSVAEALAGQEQGGDDLKLLYLGMANGIEATLVARSGLPFAAVRAGAIRGGAPHRVVMSVGKLATGLVQAWQLLGRFKPDAVLSTGGYVSVPVALAAWLRRVPVLIYLPDVTPGWAVRLLARVARKVAVTSEASRAHLPREKVVVTGYPVRGAFGSIGKAEARRVLNLDGGLPVLLVWGGSRGARSLNRALAGILSEVLELAQVVHICGAEDEADFQSRRQALPEPMKGRYHVYGYMHSELPIVMAAADLAVSRSGASVMGEFPASGLPSIVAPYPFAGGHQRLNAAALVDAGAAILIEDAELEASLLPRVRELLSDASQLGRMAAAARALARPDAARSIAMLLRNMGSGRA